MKNEIKLEQAENNEMFLLAECWNLTTKSHSNTGRRDDRRKYFEKKMGSMKKKL